MAVINLAVEKNSTEGILITLKEEYYNGLGVRKFGW